MFDILWIFYGRTKINHLNMTNICGNVATFDNVFLLPEHVLSKMRSETRIHDDSLVMVVFNDGYNGYDNDLTTDAPFLAILAFRIDNIGNTIITYIDSSFDDRIHQKRLLNIVRSLHPESETFVKLSDKNTEEIRFLICECGFNRLVSIPDDDAATTYLTGSSPDVINKAGALLRIAGKDSASIKLVVPTHTFRMMSDFLARPKEVGGILKISAYDENSIAMLELDQHMMSYSQNEDFTVLIPLARFNFHTHPDSAYVHYGTFLGWPSSLDVGYIANSHLANQGVIMHFVPSSEGVWVMNLTLDFQRFLKQVRNLRSVDGSGSRCGDSIYAALVSLFTAFESERMYKNTRAIQRHGQRRKYEEVTHNTTLADLVILFPELRSACVNVPTPNTTIMSIRLLKWEDIASVAYTEFNVEYIHDDQIGMPKFIPVEMVSGCTDMIQG